MLETDRLILRAYKESDMDELIENMCHYEVQVRDSYGFVAPRTPKFRERFQSIVRDPTFLTNRPCIVSP